jgi:hypothetical protein
MLQCRKLTLSYCVGENTRDFKALHFLYFIYKIKSGPSDQQINERGQRRESRV